MTPARLVKSGIALLIAYIILGAYMFGALPLSYAAGPSGTVMEEVPLSAACEEVSYRSQLDERNQGLYDALEEGMRSMSFGVAPENGFSDEEVGRAWEYVLHDNPDIFWVGSTYRTSRNAWGVSFVYLHYRIGNVSQVKEMYDQHNQIADAFVAECRAEGLDDWQIAQRAFEKVCALATYAKHGEDGQSIDTVFDSHITVCAGYSRAYKFLLNRAGIPCLYVIGSTSSEDFGQSYHAWNAIKIGDNNIYADVTWGDAEDVLNLEKFGVQHSEFSRDHVECSPELVDSILKRCRIMDKPVPEGLE